MFNKKVKYIGKLFFIVSIFLAFGFSCSWAAISQSNGVLTGKSVFISQVGNDVLVAQDVTIKLEKKLPSTNDWPNSSKGSQDMQDYEDLEDPFAGSEEDIPILSDPLEGYNRWMIL